MLRRVAGLPSISATNRIDGIGPESCADQILVELTESDHMLGDGRLSDTRTVKQDDVLRQRALGLNTDSGYSAVAQIVEISEEIAFVSFHPSLGRWVSKPGKKSIEITRVCVDGFGSTQEPAQPNHERTGVGNSTDSRVQVPPEVIPVLLMKAVHQLTHGHRSNFRT